MLMDNEKAFWSLQRDIVFSHRAATITTALKHSGQNSAELDFRRVGE
jgi:hypothetical protein